MARPTFSLTDAEARQLLSDLVAIERSCPFDARNHRQFVREFIRIIHNITGKTFSPTIYRRLLCAYAPERKPSTSTLALEKERFVKSLALAARQDDAGADTAGLGASLAAQFRQVLDDLAERHAPRAGQQADSYLQAQCEFLQQRLTHSEKQLAETRAATSQIDAQRQVLEAQLLQGREELETLRASGAAIQGRLADLTRSIDDARQFALVAIDEARGETRAWKERCLAAEAQLKGQISLTETFRRLAYRQGADIPPALEGRIGKTEKIGR